MQSLVLSLVFLVTSETFVYVNGFFWLFFPVLFLFSFFSSWYKLKKPNLVILVSFIPIIEFILFYISQDPQIRHLATFISFLAFYFLFELNFKKSYLIIIAFLEFLLMSFIMFIFHSLYEMPFFVSFISIFITSFLLFFSSINGILKLGLKLKFRLFYFSLILAVVISEFFWIFTKFPYNFVTSGFLLFLIYYIIWDLTIRYFASSLTKRTLVLTAIFLFLLLALIFSTIAIFWK